MTVLEMVRIYCADVLSLELQHCFDAWWHLESRGNFCCAGGVGSKASCQGYCAINAPGTRPRRPTTQDPQYVLQDYYLNIQENPTGDQDSREAASHAHGG